MSVVNAPSQPTLRRLRGVAGGPLATSVGASGAIVLLNVLTGILLARTLGPHDRGALAAVYLWPLIFSTLGAFGVADATTFYVARASAPLGTLVGTSCALALMLAVLLSGAAAAVIPFVLSGYGPAARHAAFLFLLYVPMNLVTLSLIGALNGLHRFGSFNVARISLILVTAAGMVATAVAHDITVRNAIIVYLIAGGAWTATSAFLVVRAGATHLRVSRTVARQLLGYGVRSHPGAVSGMLNELLDKLVISVYLGATKLGLYVIAVTLTGLTDIVGSSVAMVALPAVARHDDPLERAAAARRFVSLTLLLAVIVTAPIVVFVPALIRLFFGIDYLGAVDVTRVLLLAGIVLSTNRVLGAVLRALDRPLDASRGQLVALVVTVVSLAALLPTLGLIGAGAASLLAYAVSMAALVRHAARRLDLPVARLLLPRRDDVGLGGSRG